MSPIELNKIEKDRKQWKKITYNGSNKTEQNRIDQN